MNAQPDTAVTINQNSNQILPNVVICRGQRFGMVTHRGGPPNLKNGITGMWGIRNYRRMWTPSTLSINWTPSYLSLLYTCGKIDEVPLCKAGCNKVCLRRRRFGQPAHRKKGGKSGLALS